MSWQPKTAVARAVYDCGFEYVGGNSPTGDIIKSRMNAWQRHFGYCWAYDVGAATASMIIDCEPFYFVYKDRLWMIELWKGQYGVETGCEIGLYRDALDQTVSADDALDHAVRGDQDLTALGQMRFYNCVGDSDLLTMQFTLFRNGQPLIQRGPEKHWWLTGFRWGVFTPSTHDLSMDVKITGFPSKEMCASFAKAVKLKGYSPNMLGDTGISFTFRVPRTPQPLSTNLSPLMQSNNQLLVELYNTYKKWHGFKNNDPNNMTDLDPALRVLNVASDAYAKIRSVPLLGRALDTVSAAAAKAEGKVEAVLPHEVATAYLGVNKFFEGAKKWHHGRH